MTGLFIMDVSGSTSHDNMVTVSRLLVTLEENIKNWTSDFKSYINYRMGDELFFICESPSTTLVLAYYIKLVWPLFNQPVKFGIAVGDIEFPNQHIEQWNDPLIKSARIALNDIKSNDAVDFKLVGSDEDALYNDVLFYYLTDIMQNQTPLQREIFLASLTTDSQKELAALTRRSNSTISNHLKKGRSKQLHLIEQLLIQFDTSFNHTLKTNFYQFLSGEITK